MVLEKHVELVRASTNAAKHITSHELVHVGPKSVNDVVVIPNVYLELTEWDQKCQTSYAWSSRTYSGNLPVGRSKRLSRIPSDVVFEIVVVAIRSQLLGELVFSTFVGIRDTCPCCQWPIHANAVIVDLVASAKHYVERHLAMSAHDVVPESRTTPGFFIGSYRKAVAGVEHDWSSRAC